MRTYAADAICVLAIMHTNSIYGCSWSWPAYTPGSVTPGLGQHAGAAVRSWTRGYQLAYALHALAAPNAKSLLHGTTCNAATDGCPLAGRGADCSCSQGPSGAEGGVSSPCISYIESTVCIPYIISSTCICSAARFDLVLPPPHAAAALSLRTEPCWLASQPSS